MIAPTDLNLTPSAQRIVTDPNKAIDKEAFDVAQNMVLKVQVGANYSGVLPVLLQNGAKQPVTIRFVSSKLTENNQLSEEFAQEMMLAAVDAAHANARAIAKRVGLNPGPVLDVAVQPANVNGGFPQVNNANAPVLFSASGAQEIPVAMTATVTIAGEAP